MSKHERQQGERERGGGEGEAGARTPPAASRIHALHRRLPQALRDPPPPRPLASNTLFGPAAIRQRSSRDNRAARPPKAISVFAPDRSGAPSARETPRI